MRINLKWGQMAGHGHLYDLDLVRPRSRDKYRIVSKLPVQQQGRRQGQPRVKLLKHRRYWRSPLDQRGCSSNSIKLQASIFKHDVLTVPACWYTSFFKLRKHEKHDSDQGKTPIRTITTAEPKDETVGDERVRMIVTKMWGEGGLYDWTAFDTSQSPMKTVPKKASEGSDMAKPIGPKEGALAKISREANEQRPRTHSSLLRRLPLPMKTVPKKSGYPNTPFSER